VAGGEEEREVVHVCVCVCVCVEEAGRRGLLGETGRAVGVRGARRWRVHVGGWADGEAVSLMTLVE
jgi:hypothetical protein